MNQAKKTSFRTAGVVMATLALLASIYIFAAEEKPKKKGKAETIQCQAMGTSTQMGRSVAVTIIIEEYSTPEDKDILLEAFNKKGSEGLCNAVSKMPSKGRIAITGTVGYDVNYIREFPAENGRKIRMVTDRPITFGEAWYSGRSMDYNLSALELDLSNEKGKSTGKLLPACMLKVNKKTGETEIETYKNPWNLVAFIDWNKPE
jgi:hypothetical protein